jgi:hypothetical protein
MRILSPSKSVWAKGVASIGGASLGLTLSANNHAAADWVGRQYGG